MSFNLGVLGAAVGLDDSEFKSKLQALPGTADSAFKKIAGLAATYLTLRGVSQFAASSLAAFQVQERAVTSLNSALQVSGELVEAHSNRLQKLASDLQTVTQYGDEGTIAAMAMGLNMGISADQMEDATRAAMGLAAAYNLDLNTAMQLIAKAHAGNTGILSRYGIMLDQTKSKEEQFNELLEKGKKFFPVAEADSATKAINQFKNTLGDSMEVVGRVVADTLVPLANGAKAVMEAFNGLSPGVQTLIVRLTAGAIAYRLLTSQVAGFVMGLLKSTAAQAADTAAKGRNTAAVTGNSLAISVNTGAVTANGIAVAKTTAAVGGYTLALGRNTAANVINAGSITATSVAGTGLFSKLIGWVGAVTGITKGVTLISTGAAALAAKLGLTAGAAAVAGPALAAVGTAVAGWGIGRAIAKLTGLDEALTDLYGKWFFGMEEIEARSRELDRKLMELKKRAAEKKRQERAGADMQEVEADYKISVMPEGERDAKALEKLRTKLDEVVKAKNEALKEGNNVKALEQLRKEIDLRKQVAEIEARRKAAADKVAQTRRDNAYNNADDAGKEAQLDREIAEKRAALATTAGSKAEADYNAHELDQLNEILKLEQKRLELQKERAEKQKENTEAFAEERAAYAESEERRQRQAAKDAVDRQIQALQKKDDKAGIDALLQSELAKAQAAAAQMKQQYEDALKDAEKDGVFTSEERKKVAEARRKLDEANQLADEYAKRRLDREAEGNGKEKEQQKSAGSFSAAVLDAMLGASVPEQETARNTKEQLRLTRELIDKTGNGSTLTYGD